MKTIKFEKLKLLNFCGIREGEYEFGDNITTISGKNGIGKSTLASAITYVLFGSDINGRQLDIKTLDENNKVIKDVPHEAELTLSVDEDVITLKRTLTDSWKGDSVKNTFKYFINGEVATAGDFKKTVDGICQEKTFRLCSSPTEFVSMSWQEQHAFLSTLVPAVTFEDVANGDEKYDFIADSVKKNATNNLIKHLKYNRNEVQKSLEQVPTRLTELNKLLPNEEENWEELENTLADKKNALNEVNGKITSINCGNANDVAKDGIRNKLTFANKRIANMEQSARNEASLEAEKHQSDVITCNDAVAKAQREVEDMKATIRSCTDTRVNVGKQLEEAKAKAKEGSKEFKEVSSSQWSWNDDDSFCPHCGQILPQDKLQEIKKESNEKFNKDKAEKLKNLAELAASIKKEITEANKLLKDNDDKEADTLAKLKAARENLSSAERELEKIKLEKPKTYELILSEKEEYSKVKEEIEQLQAELDNPTVTDEEARRVIEALYEQRETLEDEIEHLEERYAQKASIDKVNARITEVNEDKKKFQSQIDELDRQIDIASEFVQRSFEILSERVNDKFSFVKWIMFQTTNDGEKKPYCECSHNGVPYSALNDASKINAGIDIAHTICNFYEVSVPMLIDGCESVQKPIYEGGQQIRFSVGNSNILDFKYSDGSQD